MSRIKVCKNHPTKRAFNGWDLCSECLDAQDQNEFLREQEARDARIAEFKERFFEAFPDGIINPKEE